MRHFIVIVAFAFSYGSTNAEINATWPQGGGPLTVETDRPYQWESLEIGSHGKNLLTTGRNPAPYQFFIPAPMQANVDRVVLSGLGVAAPTFDGTVTLDLFVDREAMDGDLWGSAGQWHFPDPFTPRISTEPLSEPLLRAEYPRTGGPITLFSTGGPIEVEGIVITSDGGFLDYRSPKPFSSVESIIGSSSHELQFAGSVTIEGSLVLDVDILSQAPTADISVGYRGTSGGGIVPVTAVPEAGVSPSCFWVFCCLLIRRLR